MSGVDVPTDVPTEASVVAETWLSQLARLPRSSWLAPICVLLERLPIALEHAGGNAGDLTDADLCTLEALTPLVASLVRQCRNASTPVLHLPAEILAEIFLIVRDVHDPDWRDDTSMAMEWIRACTHVCHKWREVALKLPFLWTSIDLSRTAATMSAVMMERASAQSFHVRMSRPSHGVGQLQLFENLRLPVKTMDLNLSTGSFVALPFIVDNAYCTSDLTSLKLAVPNCPGDMAPRSPFPRPAFISVSLHECNFPALRELTLTDCTIFLRDEMMNTAPFPRLEKIRIDCHRIQRHHHPRPILLGHNRPFLSDLFKITPRLRELSLLKPFPGLFRVQDHRPETPPMQLPPQLTRISITTNHEMRKMDFYSVIRQLDLAHVPRLQPSLRISRGDRRAYRMRTSRIRDILVYLQSQRDIRTLHISVSPSSLGRVSTQRNIEIHALSRTDHSVHEGAVSVALEDYPRDDLLAEVMNCLPPGWEARKQPSGQVYFVDHTTLATTWIDPRSSPQYSRPLSSVESILYETTPHAPLQVTSAWWYHNFAGSRAVREVGVKGGFDSAFALVRALSTVKDLGAALFPNLEYLRIMDGDSDHDVSVDQTIGWRRVRALERCLARDINQTGVARITVLSLPPRFENKTWATRLRGTVECLQFH